MEFQPTYSTEDKILQTPQNNGAFYISTDTFKMYADIDNQRLDLTDVVVLKKDIDRNLISHPKQRLYVTLDTHSIYTYSTDWIKLTSSVTEESLQALLDTKQNKLIAGEGISINGNVISSSGSGGSAVAVDLHMTNNIITAPNGVATYSGDTFTLKSGLTFNFSNGKFSGIKQYKVISLTEDVGCFVNSNTEAGQYVLFITEDGGFWEEPYKIFIKCWKKDKVIFHSNTPDLPSPGFAVFYPDENEWIVSHGIDSFADFKVTPIGEFSWNGTAIESFKPYFPVETAKELDLIGKQDVLVAGEGITIDNNVVSASIPSPPVYTAGENIQISSSNVISATDTLYTAGTGVTISNNKISIQNNYLTYSRLREGIWEYPPNGIYIVGNTIYFKTGLKLLQANGRNYYNTYKNSLAGLTTDLTLQYAYTGTGTTPIYGTAFVRGNKYTMRVQKDYIYNQEEEPPITTGFISAWYKPSEHKWYYASGSATSWIFNIMCPVCDFVYDRGAKVFTSVTPHEVVRMVTYQEYKTLKDEIELLKAKIK